MVSLEILTINGYLNEYYNATYLAEIQAATGSEIMTIEGVDHKPQVSNL